MSGQTVASDPLKADVLRILEPFMQGRTGCTERLERIETEVVGREGEWRIDDRDQVVAGTIVEIWTAHMCGRSARFVVKFTPDGLGGTFITVQPEEKASSVKTQEAVPPVP